MYATISVTPACSAASTIASASVRLKAMGFSTSTCLPAWAAAIAGSLWIGVAITTASTSPCSSSACTSVKRRSTPKRSPTCSTTRGEISHTAVTRKPGSSVRKGRCIHCAISPHPITPTLTIRMGYVLVSVCQGAGLDDGAGRFVGVNLAPGRPIDQALEFVPAAHVVEQTPAHPLHHQVQDLGAQAGKATLGQLARRF